MGRGAAKTGLAGADGEIEAQLPERIAGRLRFEREHLGIIVGIE